MLLQWDQLFTFVPDGVVGGRIDHPFDLTRMHFLKYNCTLWDRFNADKHGELEHFLQYQIANTDTSGQYMMGSGMKSRAPRLSISEIFAGFAPKVVQGIDFLRKKLNSSHYGCIHLRSGDASLHDRGNGTYDEGLKKWVEEQRNGGLLDASKISQLGFNSDLDFNRENPNTSNDRIDIQARANQSFWDIVNGAFSALTGNFESKSNIPLFIMSGMPENLVLPIIKNICKGDRRSWSKCIFMKDLLPEGLKKASGIDLKIPNDQAHYEQLILEIALCSQANAIYLPSSGRVLLAQNQIKAKRVGTFSTLSAIVGAMHTFSRSE